MKAILIPVLGPFEEVEFETLVDIGECLGIEEGDRAGRLEVDKEHSIICPVVEVGALVNLNIRATNLVPGLRIYGPAVYVRESRHLGSASVESFDDVEVVMEHLYRAVVKNRAFQPPV